MLMNVLGNKGQAEILPKNKYSASQLDDILLLKI